jgi:hypothetical protein
MGLGLGTQYNPTQQFTPWGGSPYASQGLGMNPWQQPFGTQQQFGQSLGNIGYALQNPQVLQQVLPQIVPQLVQLLQTVPQQIQQVQQLQQIQLQQLQQLQQILHIIPGQLQQLQQLIQYVPQQIQQLQQPSQLQQPFGLGTFSPFGISPQMFGGQQGQFGAQSGHVM